MAKKVRFPFTPEDFERAQVVLWPYVLSGRIAEVEIGGNTITFHADQALLEELINDLRGVFGRAALPRVIPRRGIGGVKGVQRRRPLNTAGSGAYAKTPDPVGLTV